MITVSVHSKGSKGTKVESENDQPTPGNVSNFIKLSSNIQIWNKIIVWPKLPHSYKKFSFRCQYCRARFSNKQALGGHTSQAHPGRSTTYQYTMTRRVERVKDRQVHKLAKEIYQSQRLNLLDFKTFTTFKQQRNRLAQHEMATPQNIANDSKSFEQMKKMSDKGRIRKLKLKVWAVVRMSYTEQ